MAFADVFHPKFKSDLKKNEEVVFHYMVATRENFYKKLENRMS